MKDFEVHKQRCFQEVIVWSLCNDEMTFEKKRIQRVIQGKSLIVNKSVKTPKLMFQVCR